MKKISDLEESLWMQIRVAGLPIPHREFKFAEPVGRKYRSDFAWPSHMLLVEVDGGTWRGGRHNTGSGYAEDCNKLNLATLLGYRVLRFTAKEIKKGTALNQIETALAGGFRTTEPQLEMLGLRACGLGQ
jgi:very-short-patch-repair endonuclease